MAIVCYHGNTAARPAVFVREEDVMNQEVYEKVKAIIIDTLAVEEGQITPEARFREDLGADSLDLVELIMAFEDEFGSQISDDDARSITTVEGAVKFISEKMQGGT